MSCIRIGSDRELEKKWVLFNTEWLQRVDGWASKWSGHAFNIYLVFIPISHGSSLKNGHFRMYFLTQI